ncbi:hypothetical protein ACJJTC_006493 [Scirpophaga incertulas]
MYTYIPPSTAPSPQDQLRTNGSDEFSRSRWRASLLDVRNRRGADIDSDHHLVVAEVRLKVAVALRTEATHKIGKRFEVNRLRDKNTHAAFKIELRNRFSVLETDSTSVDTEWNHIKMVYTETSSVVLGHKTNSREDWMSQRTWDLIGQRRELHLQLLAAGDEAARQNLKQQYRLIRKTIYRSTRRDRRIWADNVAECAQRAADAGNLRHRRDSFNAGGSTLRRSSEPTPNPVPPPYLLAACPHNALTLTYLPPPERK